MDHPATSSDLQQWLTHGDGTHLWLGSGTGSGTGSRAAGATNVGNFSCDQERPGWCLAMGQRLKMLAKPLYKPNGFADHYPVFKWLFHWGY